MKASIALTTSFSVLLLFYCAGCQSTPLKAEEHIVNKIERTYNVETGGNLTIVSEFGAIDVHTAEEDKIEIVVTKESKFKLLGSAQEMLEDFELAFKHEDADVHIEGVFKRGREHWRKQLNRLKIQFLVTIPKAYNVDLDTASGSISVADLNGNVRAKTSGGSLRFGNITGTVWGRTSGGSIKLTSSGSPATLKTSGGSIEVGDVAGDIHVQTSGGNLRFGEIQGSVSGKTSGGSIKVGKCSGGVDVHTSGGNITLESVTGSVNAKTSGGSIQAALIEQLHDECSLRTSGGNITVTLIPDIAIDVDATTGGGNVSTDFTVASTIQGKVPKNRLKGSINSGGSLLKLHTSGGNIRLQKAAD